MLDYIGSEKARQDLKKFLIGKVGQDQLGKLQYDKLKNIKRLFKYSSINEYTSNNIKNNYLIANKPKNFNDSFDSKMYVNNYINNKNKIENSIRLSKKFGYDSPYEVVSENKIKEDSRRQDIFLEDYFRNDLYINSLTDTNSNILMWSHYACNNSGICTEYNFNNTTSEFLSLIYPVIYIDEPIEVTELIGNETDIKLAILISAICKYRDWKYENEWRIIFNIPFSGLKNKSNDILEIKAPSISSIYLGKKFLDYYNKIKYEKKSPIANYYKSFLSTVKEKNIKIKITKPQVRSYKLEFEEIDIEILE